VLGDDNLRSNHSDARSLEDDVKSRSESIDRMTRSLRGSNHPLVSWILDQGNRAHADRHSTSDAKEFSLNSGRFDCT